MPVALSRRRFLALAGFGLAASYPFFIERYIVLTNTYRIPVPNLPPAFNGFRIVHLTDLRYASLPLGLLRQVVARANRIPRDVTVCTGDYVLAQNAQDELPRHARQRGTRLAPSHC
jgi:predicted MPP superfamily phosphohydrolase